MKIILSIFLKLITVLFLFSIIVYGCSSDSAGKNKVELEKERLALERDKLEFEKQKIELERQKMLNRLNDQARTVREQRNYDTKDYNQPQRTSTRYFVVMDQIDDVGTIFLNGAEIASCEWQDRKNGRISPIDITNQLRSGKNTVRFNLYNKEWKFFGGRYSYHFKLYKRTDGRKEVMFDRQGSRSDKTAGERFDESYSFNKE